MTTRHIMQLSFTCYISILIISSTSYGQFASELGKVTPVSPAMATFDRYGSYPVNYNTGLPEISIPLYNLQLKDFNYPISMSFHASGRTAALNYSSLGVGWALNVTGYISREIRERPDEYYGPGMETTREELLANNNSPNDFYYDKLLAADLAINQQAGIHGLYEKLDAEHDIYSYNVNGISGKFIINQYDDIIQLTSSAIKVSGGPGNFVLTDELSNMYEFLSNPNSTEYCSLYVAGNPTWVPTGWYLNKVTTAAKDVIVFNYAYRVTNSTTDEIEGSVSIAKTISAKFSSYNSGANIAPTVTTSNSFSTREYSISYLKSIDFPEGKIVLDYNDQALRLNIITLKNIENNTVKSYEFSYMQTPGTISKLPNNNSSSIGDIKMRDSQGEVTGKYSFSYYDYLLQYSNSPIDFVQKSDWWGYSNNLGDGFPLDPSSDQDVIGYGCGDCKTANFYNKLSGMIKTITYPTGGHTEFTFEANKYMPFEGPLIEMDGPGIRIKEIVSYDGINEVGSKRLFKYGENESGIGILIYHPYRQDYKFDLSNANWTYDCATADEIDASLVGLYRTTTYLTSPLPSIAEAYQQPIFYTDVAEYSQTTQGFKNGRTIYRYSTPGYEYSRYSLPKTFRLKLWQGGKLISRDIQEFRILQNDYFTVESLGFTYTLRNYRKISQVRMQRNWTITCNGTISYGSPRERSAAFTPWQYRYSDLYSIENYPIETGVEKLETETKNVIDEFGKFTHSLIRYNYDGALHLQPTLIERKNSKNEDLLTTLKYPNDFGTLPVYQEMINRNLITPVIERTEKKLSVDEELSRTKVDYSFFNNNTLVKPSSILQSIKGNPMRPVKMITSYDTKGNILESLESDGLRMSYRWDDYGKLIAQVSNAFSKDIFYTSFENSEGNSSDWDSKTGLKSRTNGYFIVLNGLSSGDYILSYWTKSGITWSFQKVAVSVNTSSYAIDITGQLDELRFYPKLSQIQTFSYEPLVGMVNTMNENDRATSYRYDNFQRLQFIKDHDNNILKKFEYKYADREVFTKPVLQALLDDFLQVRPGGVRAFFAVPFNYSPVDTNKFIRDTRLMYRDGLAQLPAQYQSIPFASSGWYTAFNLQLANPYDPVYHDAQQFTFMQSGYAVEWRLKMPRSPANGHIVGVGSYFNFNAFFARRADGYYLTGFSDFDGHSYGSDNAANFPPDNQFSELPVGGVDLFDDFATIKLQVTPTRYYVYVNGQLKFDVARDNNGPNGGSKPIDTHFYVDALFFGNAGAVDYIKIFDNDGALKFDEDFSTPMNPKRPDPLLIFPTPVNCMSAFVNFFNLRNGSGYTQSEIIQIYDRAGQTLNPCN